ncbi:unnamed protein product [Rotaria sordida]|uniref:Uncharacterized protein n=1 Tax=Rotaria sordida TaxID=392033 RepID=A0A815U318_9BILA|nr:unnamed protein product [Rotaria sordida]CAF1510832.1 unnamed protein product [Rotaria sordida]
MVKYETKIATIAVVLVMIIFHIGVINGQQCVTNSGNGYCCSAAYPMCVQGFPKCCPSRTIFYYNGYCYFRSGKSTGNDTKTASADVAFTII